VGDKYRLESKIGGGGFGHVYLGWNHVQLHHGYAYTAQGINTENNHQVAIKLEDVFDHDPSFLETEIESYHTLSGGVGIPSLHWSGQEDEYRVMVFELLGPSLEDLFNYCSRRFSLKTVLMLFDQLICRLEYIHSKKILHRDIKPDNFLMGVGRCGNKVYLTDFGLAIERHPRDELLPRTKKPTLIGTEYFASINGHYGQSNMTAPSFGESRTNIKLEQSRYDDLESLGYIMIYFLRGALPWDDVKKTKGLENVDSVLKRKENIEVQDLCHGLPDEFVTYFNNIRTNPFSAKPGYAYFRRIFRNLYKREGYEYDNVFDWTVLNFLSNQSDQAE
jgi:casein kinase I homolog HRR25